MLATTTRVRAEGMAWEGYPANAWGARTCLIAAGLSPFAPGLAAISAAKLMARGIDDAA